MYLWKIVISYRVDEMGQVVCLVFDTMLFHRLGCYAGNTFWVNSKLTVLVKVLDCRWSTLVIRIDIGQRDLSSTVWMWYLLIVMVYNDFEATLMWYWKWIPDSATEWVGADKKKSQKRRLQRCDICPYEEKKIRNFVVFVRLRHREIEVERSTH